VTANLATLDKFTGSTKHAREKPPSVYSLPHLGEAYVLCIDQTLGHTGWGLLHVVQIDKCWVRAMEVGDFKQEPPPALQGFAADDYLVRSLASEIDNVVVHAIHMTRDQQGCVLHVVREMPAVRGPRSASSLRAATVVETVCALRGIVSAVVNSQHVKTTIAAARDASKATVKKAVQNLLPETTSMRPMNTNVTDALAIGLTWLLDNP
jgi:hypothetical protein